VKSTIPVAVIVVCLTAQPWAEADDLLGPFERLPDAISPHLAPAIFKLRNLTLHGKVIEYTDHVGCDRRIWSSVLQEPRSLCVYVPPNFDPHTRYPLVVYLHGIIEDERFPLIDAVPYFDRAIASGRVPPMIVVVPGGHIPGSFFDSHFLNHKSGRYEDFLLYDIVPFMEANYPICPERGARAIMGFSISGWAAYSVALKNTACFGAVVGILPPLNMRWVDCHGNYRANFDPNCWGWRTELNEDETMGWWYGMRVTLSRTIKPYFGWGPEGLAWLASENPIEILDRYQIMPGEIAMYVAYIRHDEFNLDAQVESFLTVARQRGLCVTVDYKWWVPTHTLQTCMNRFPRAIEWLGAQFAPYAPPRSAVHRHCFAN
jgi:hypothetical protein